jgi:hypothetical protein
VEDDGKEPASCEPSAAEDRHLQRPPSETGQGGPNLGLQGPGSESPPLNYSFDFLSLKTIRFVSAVFLEIPVHIASARFLTYSMVAVVV